jgi:hypothetical protein
MKDIEIVLAMALSVFFLVAITLVLVSVMMRARGD